MSVVVLEKDVFVFIIENFFKIIMDNFFIVVEFYVFWCGYCKKLVFEVSFGCFMGILK